MKEASLKFYVRVLGQRKDAALRPRQRNDAALHSRQRNDAALRSRLKEKTLLCLTPKKRRCFALASKKRRCFALAPRLLSSRSVRWRRCRHCGHSRIKRQSKHEHLLNIIIIFIRHTHMKEINILYNNFMHWRRKFIDWKELSQMMTNITKYLLKAIWLAFFSKRRYKCFFNRFVVISTTIR